MARIGFAASAHKQFQTLPERAQAGLMRKLKDVAEAPNLAKPLTGELAGFYRITYGRLRCIVRLTAAVAVVLVVSVSPRKEGARDDAYRRAVDALRTDPSVEGLFADHVRAYMEEQRLGALRRQRKKSARDRAAK